MADVTEVFAGDFHKMPFEDNSFDAVFSVEATCHASDVRNFTIPMSCV
jgi:24-methylenesterol C-methyltransferase